MLCRFELCGPEGRSTTGYAFFMNGGCVRGARTFKNLAPNRQWGPKWLQHAPRPVKLNFSTTCCTRCKTAMVIGMKHRHRLVFHEDNSACIVFCNNNSVTGKNKKIRHIGDRPKMLVDGIGDWLLNASINPSLTKGRGTVSDQGT